MLWYGKINARKNKKLHLFSNNLFISRKHFIKCHDMARFQNQKSKDTSKFVKQVRKVIAIALHLSGQCTNFAHPD